MMVIPTGTSRCVSVPTSTQSPVLGSVHPFEVSSEYPSRYDCKGGRSDIESDLLPLLTLGNYPFLWGPSISSRPVDSEVSDLLLVETT